MAAESLSRDCSADVGRGCRIRSPEAQLTGCSPKTSEGLCSAEGTGKGLSQASLLASGSFVSCGRKPQHSGCSLRACPGLNFPFNKDAGHLALETSTLICPHLANDMCDHLMSKSGYILRYWDLGLMI